MTFDFPALGSHWWLEIWDDVSEQTSLEIQSYVIKIATCFERKYSRFLPESVISRLNRERVLTLDDDSLAIIRYGIELFERSNGIFNILVGHILEARGYDQHYSLTDNGSQTLTAGNPKQDIVFNDNVVSLKHGNIDIGGYGKGWLIDVMSQWLKSVGITQFLINGGGDIYVTHHGNQPIEIYLENPHESGKVVGGVLLKNRAFAASSPHKRSWPIKQCVDGEEQISTQNHIVSFQSMPYDSRQEMKDIIYLTAPNAVDADAFATTLLQADTLTSQKILEAEQLSLITP